jgi:GrpB-like predicted nucleotidyltransferase (UPF0157 family)
MKELDKNIKRKYSISDYDSNWVNQFNSIQQFLLDIFGDRAIQIEHVGSTAIPGMKAKPLIDVLVVVEKMADFAIEKKIMVEAGYEWGENYITPDSLLFFKLNADGEKLENIHVCERGSSKVKQFLVMRDFLRTFPIKAKEYSDLKEDNAKKYPDDYPAYRAAKASFLEKIEKEAYAWDKSKINIQKVSG